MSRIDRYLLFAFCRTLLICFFSLGGVFVIIHAFSNLEELESLGRQYGGLLKFAMNFYGPLLLVVFDWTVEIMVAMAILFTVSQLRRTGELTAILAAGVGHGRVLRPLLQAAAVVILFSALSREVLLPKYRDSLAARPQDLTGEAERSLQPSLDRQTGILIGGKGLRVVRREIVKPVFFLHAPIGAFGPRIAAQTATWLPATRQRPSGYLLTDVQVPEKVSEISSASIDQRTVIFSPKEYPNLMPNRCFVASDVSFELLEASSSGRSYLTWWEMVKRVRNPASHIPADLRVALHTRPLRPLTDFAIILVAVGFVATASERNMFAVAFSALFFAMIAQLIKTGATAAGSAGFLFTPEVAAWVPLLLLGPLGYTRWRTASLR